MADVRHKSVRMIDGTHIRVIRFQNERIYLLMRITNLFLNSLWLVSYSKIPKQIHTFESYQNYVTFNNPNFLKPKDLNHVNELKNLKIRELFQGTYKQIGFFLKCSYFDEDMIPEEHNQIRSYEIVDGTQLGKNMTDDFFYRGEIKNIKNNIPLQNSCILTNPSIETLGDLYKFLHFLIDGLTFDGRECFSAVFNSRVYYLNEKRNLCDKEKSNMLLFNFTLFRNSF